MKSALTSSVLAFIATAALVQLNLLPDAWGVATQSDDSAFAVRHAAEDAGRVEAELGLDHSHAVR
jgi:hypothetical protein